MKKCTQCFMEKPLASFPFRNKADGTLNSCCLECQKGKSRAHYQKNKQAYFKRADATRKRNYLVIRELKNKPCYDCGRSYPYYVMDFDHRNPADKRFGIAYKSRVASSLKAMMIEIEKCDLVCANCHRERTWGRSSMNRADAFEA